MVGVGLPVALAVNDAAWPRWTPTDCGDDVTNGAQSPWVMARLRDWPAAMAVAVVLAS